LTQKETTGNSSADVKNKGVSHPAPKKKKTAVVIGIIVSLTSLYVESFAVSFASELPNIFTAAIIPIIMTG